MLSEFRPADAPRLFELLQENFPEEEALYGMRPEAFAKVVRRIYRWDTRLVLGFLRRIGRPTFRFFTIEAGSTIVASTILSFGRKAGYISMVMVDPAYRRRGYARQLLHASAEAARRCGRPYVALDVLEKNATARELYDSEGYLPLRPAAVLVWTPETDRRDRPTRVDPGIRPFQKSDAAALVAVLERATPPEVAEVLPVNPRALNPSGQLDAILTSKTMVWVLDEGSGPVAHVLATVSDVMDSGHLSGPVVSEGADMNRVSNLISTALDWLTAEGATRVVAQLPLAHRAGLAALEGGGFRVAHELRTLYRSSS